MFDEDTVDDHLDPLMFWVGVTCDSRYIFHMSSASNNDSSRNHRNHNPVCEEVDLERVLTIGVTRKKEISINIHRPEIKKLQTPRG